MRKQDNKAFFLGTMPPPIGGVTIYNSRKIEYLRSFNQVDVLQPKISNLVNIFLIICFSRKDVYISSMNIILVIFNIFSIFKKKIFIDHNASRDFFNINLLEKLIYSISLSRAHQIILVNGHLKDNYKQLFSFNYKFVVESAFLPPDLSKKNLIRNTYPSVLRQNEKRDCIVASISKPSLKDGKDVYNSDLILDLFDFLSLKFPLVLFVVAVSDVSGVDTYSKYIVEKAKLMDEKYSNFTLLSDGKTLWPLFEKSILYFRPTLTDGDSITIHEANYFGAKVLCSDVVDRPDFCQLFNLESDDVIALITSILDEKNECD